MRCPLFPCRLVLLALVAAAAAPLAGCDGGATLPGTWQPAPDAAALDALGARYTFFADGRVRIVTPGGASGAEPQVYEARYTTAGDTLLTLADGQGRERFRMQLTADTLWLQSPVTGQDTRLVRVHVE